MNKLHDSDLREALIRREAKRRPQPLSDDFCSHVMQKIDRTPSRRSWLYAATAIAAGTLLLLTIHTETPTEDVLHIPRESPAVSQASLAEHPVEAIEERPVVQQVASATPVRRRPPVQTTTDSTALLAAEVEDMLQQVSDSCYMAHLERAIACDPELCKMVNDFINQADEPRQTALFIKAM